MFGPPGSSTSTSPTACTGAPTSCAGRRATPSAVLLRAGEVVEGVDVARARRPSARPQRRDLARGPARLAAALGLAGEHDGTDLLDARQPVRLAGALGSVTPADVRARAACRADQGGARPRGGSGCRTTRP